MLGDNLTLQISMFKMHVNNKIVVKISHSGGWNVKFTASIGTWQLSTDTWSIHANPRNVGSGRVFERISSYNLLHITSVAESTKWSIPTWSYSFSCLFCLIHTLICQKSWNTPHVPIRCSRNYSQCLLVASRLPCCFFHSFDLIVFTFSADRLLNWVVISI